MRGKMLSFLDQGKVVFHMLVLAMSGDHLASGLLPFVQVLLCLM